MPQTPEPNPRKRGKRANGEGSLYFHKGSGKWAMALTLSDGKRKTVYGETQKEVREKAKELQRRDDAGVAHTPKQTLNQFLENWLERSVKIRTKERTYESYHAMVRLHIAPYAPGRVPLERITADHVQTWLDELQKKTNLSPRSITYALSILRNALNQAVKWQLIVRNVATLVDAPRVPKFHAEPLTQEQPGVFFKRYKGNDLRHYTGLRLRLVCAEVKSLR